MPRLSYLGLYERSVNGRLRVLSRFDSTYRTTGARVAGHQLLPTLSDSLAAEHPVDLSRAPADVGI
jgi:hypothetical protein